MFPPSASLTSLSLFSCTPPTVITPQPSRLHDVRLPLQCQRSSRRYRLQRSTNNARITPLNGERACVFVPKSPLFWDTMSASLLGASVAYSRHGGTNLLHPPPNPGQRYCLWPCPDNLLHSAVNKCSFLDESQRARKRSKSVADKRSGDKRCVRASSRKRN